MRNATMTTSKKRDRVAGRKLWEQCLQARVPNVGISYNYASNNENIKNQQAVYNAFYKLYIKIYN